MGILLARTLRIIEPLEGAVPTYHAMFFGMQLEGIR